MNTAVMETPRTTDEPAQDATSSPAALEVVVREKTCTDVDRLTFFTGE